MRSRRPLRSALGELQGLEKVATRFRTHPQDRDQLSEDLCLIVSANKSQTKRKPIRAPAITKISSWSQARWAQQVG
jgi:hypothetical protein